MDYTSFDFIYLPFIIGFGVLLLTYILVMSNNLIYQFQFWYVKEFPLIYWSDSISHLMQMQRQKNKWIFLWYWQNTYIHKMNFCICDSSRSMWLAFNIKFLTYGLKHPQIEVWLFGLYGQWVELGFVVIYGSITLIHWIR
jgi:hypothetical protein